MRKWLLVVIAGAFGALPAPAPVRGQAVPIVHYTFNQTAADLTGNYADATLINAPFEDGGIHLNGVYLGNDPQGAVMETAFLTGLDFTSFTVSVEFRIAAPPADWMPVLFGGPSWRWLGANVNSAGELYLTCNGMDRAPSGGTVTAGEWHELAMSYDGETAYLYLDGVPVASEAFTMVHRDDRRFTVEHPGVARTFEGHIRNLIVYDRFNDSVPNGQESFGGVKALYR